MICQLIGNGFSFLPSAASGSSGRAGCCQILANGRNATAAPACAPRATSPGEQFLRCSGCISGYHSRRRRAHHSGVSGCWQLQRHGRSEWGDIGTGRGPLASGARYATARCILRRAERVGRDCGRWARLSPSSRASGATWAAVEGCLARTPCEWGEFASLETSAALAAERVGRVCPSCTPPRTGGGGESGESVAAEGHVGCVGVCGPRGPQSKQKCGPSGAKVRLWQPRSRQVASSGASPWGATPRLCFHPPRREVGASLCEWGAHVGGWPGL